jgi:predicted AAA+ superfamily ATPase
MNQCIFFIEFVHGARGFGKLSLTKAFLTWRSLCHPELAEGDYLI